MADPRTSAGSLVQSSRPVISSLGKIGQIELLNDIGAANVGKGLRTLVGVSDTIRKGTGKLPSSAQRDANGTTYVLNETGINSNAATGNSTFHPEVFNRGMGAAKSIYESVKQGRFDWEDIPSVIGDLKNLSDLAKGVFTKSAPPRGPLADPPSPYAVDLINYAPKYKFLFVVEFLPSEPYMAKFDKLDLAFVVKSSTRPNINFEYEDVNMYNYWTKVPKRTVYEPMTMRFYDDSLNQAMVFFKSYLDEMSPIATQPDDSPEIIGSYESRSMKIGTETTASFGMNTNDDKTKNIFKQIKLYHVFGNGHVMNSHVFQNPKIVSMELDEVNHAESGDGSEFTFQFAYDAVYTDLDIAMNLSNKSSHHGTSIYKLQNRAGGAGDTFVGPVQPGGNNSEGFGGVLGAVAGIGDAITEGIGGVIDLGLGAVGAVLDVADSAIGTVLGGGSDTFTNGGFAGGTSNFISNVGSKAAGITSNVVNATSNSGFGESVRNVGASVANSSVGKAVTSTVGNVRNKVSDAFSSTSDFAGSNFTDNNPFDDNV